MKPVASPRVAAPDAHPDDPDATSPGPTVITAIALVALIAAGAVALLVQYAWLADGYMTDDAYISFRYARNLADGLGPVWQPGDRVEGYTNFGWVALLALAMRVGIDPVESSQGLGFVFSVGTLALIPALASQLRVPWTWRWWIVTVGALAALALNNAFSLWTFAGLEVPPVTFFTTAAVALHLWEERTLGRPLASAPLFVAAALMRPDAAIAFIVCAAAKCLRLTRPDRARQLAMIAMWALSFVALFGVFWLWRWTYYGDFFPNTYYLKTGQSRALFERGWQYTRDFLTVYWIWALLPAIFSIGKERLRGYAPATCIAGIVVTWLAYVAYVGGDWMPYFRFFIPLLPLIYVLAIHSVIDVVDAIATRTRLHDLVPAAAAAAAVLIAFSAARAYDDISAQNPFEGATDPLPGAVDPTAQRAIGDWMRTNVPASYTVAQIATGIVPYYSQRKTIDMLGVNDRHIAHRDLPVGHGPAGHEKEDGGYVIARRPEIIWLDLSLEPRPRLSPEDYMPPIDTRSAPVVTSITQNMFIWWLYRPVAIELEGGWLNLLVREDADLPLPE